MNKTGIEWVKNPDGTQGYTHNPVSGCKNHTPEGLCLDGLFPCYADKLANGRLKERYLANTYLAPDAKGGVSILSIDGQKSVEREGDYADPFYPRFWHERVREEFGAKTAGAIPKGIFVCDMGDLFGQGIPEQWTRRVLSHIGMSWYSEHRFYLLTKQPQNLIKFSPFPENCWVGVTATTQEMLIDAMAELHRIKATIKYISFEPLLEAMNGGECEGKRLDDMAEDIDWLIIGACTGTRKEMLALADRYHQATFARGMPLANGRYTFQPKIEWVREIVEAADKAGVPVFLKDNLVPLIAGKGTPEGLFYKDCRLRQEMPG